MMDYRDFDAQFAETEEERNERQRTRRKMSTRYLIMRPDQPHESGEIDWPNEPGYDRISKFIGPIVGGPIEHVAVLADFSGGLNFTRADMFVNEIGHVLKEPLPRNEAATLIYRRNALLNQGARDPEVLPWIAGPAVLFERLVWM
jgi:hypothetical protein